MDKPASLRDVMPHTADWIDQRRVDWGREHVDECLRNGVQRKVPGYFYAIEGGRTVGTPWPDGAVLGQVAATGPSVAELQRVAVMCGAGFAVFMREPGTGGVNGAH